MWFGHDRFTRKVFATVLGILEDPKWCHFVTVPEPNLDEFDFYDLHKVGLRQALWRILDPISIFNRWEGGFDVWGTASALVPFNSVRVAGKRLQEDVDSWLSLATLTGLEEDARSAWRSHDIWYSRPSPPGTYRIPRPHASVEPPEADLHAELMLTSPGACGPQVSVYDDLGVYRTSLVDLIIFLLAVLSRRTFVVYENSNHEKSIESEDCRILINSQKNPGLWTFILALEELSGPFNLIRLVK
jgi:hypothetical protein